MQLRLETVPHEPGSGEPITVRLLVLNDSYEPVAVDRRLLVGPNPVPEHPVGMPLPVSLEPAFPDAERNLVHLNPWCFYGRERRWERLPPGSVQVYAYLLRRPVGALLAEGPGEPDALLVAAQPLALTIRELE